MNNLTAAEIIPILLVIRDRYPEDDKSKENLYKLIDDLTPIATEEFLIKFGLISLDE